VGGTDTIGQNNQYRFSLSTFLFLFILHFFHFILHREKKRRVDFCFFFGAKQQRLTITTGITDHPVYKTNREQFWR